MTRHTAVIIGAVLLCSGSSSELRAQGNIVGHWEGAISVMGQELTVAVDVKTEAGGLKASIDIPQQGAAGVALTKVSYAPPKVHFELPAGPGLAVFDGELHGDSIWGDFSQAGISGKFHLVKRGSGTEKAYQDSVPYKQEEVRFQNDTITLAGTLTVPPTNGPHPAVIMLTGSGPQNRDEELFGFKPFKFIADHFTRNGIAVLRYDDRGVGGSTGNTSLSTTQDFAGDALAAVKFLQGRPDINPKQIGLCGHSEGGIVAPLAASRSKDVAFVVLMSGTAVTGERIILAQADLIGKAEGVTDKQLKENAELQKRLFQAVRNGRDWEKLKSDLRAKALADFKKIPAAQRQAVVDSEQFVDSRIEGQIRAVQTPWFKYFLDYDPAPALEKLNCPVLALFGERDLQVPAGMNKTAMEKALRKGGNKDYTIREFPKANHLYLTAASGSPSEYAGLKKEFVPGFLDTMTAWILARMKASR